MESGAGHGVTADPHLPMTRCISVGKLRAPSIPSRYVVWTRHRTCEMCTFLSRGGFVYVAFASGIFMASCLPCVLHSCLVSRRFTLQSGLLSLHQWLYTDVISLQEALHTTVVGVTLPARSQVLAAIAVSLCCFHPLPHSDGSLLYLAPPEMVETEVPCPSGAGFSQFKTKLDRPGPN